MAPPRSAPKFDLEGKEGIKFCCVLTSGHPDQVDDNDAMIDGVLALNTADTSFQSDDMHVRDELEEDVSEELESGTNEFCF